MERPSVILSQPNGRSIEEKRKMVSAAYMNLQQIMGYSGTSLERIRDTA